jgi:hypothetical protein
MDLQSPIAREEWSILELKIDQCGFESSMSPIKMMFERGNAVHSYAVEAAGRRVQRALVLIVVTAAVHRLVTVLVDRIDFPGPRFSDHVIASIIKPFLNYVAIELIMYAYDRAMK